MNKIILDEWDHRELTMQRRLGKYTLVVQDNEGGYVSTEIRISLTPDQVRKLRNQATL